MNAHDHVCLQVATMVRADWLFLLTDVPCLYTANPSTDPSAEPIHEVRDIAALQVAFLPSFHSIPPLLLQGSLW